MNVLIMGSTGMVGSQVLAECIKNPKITKITVVDRKETQSGSKKVKQIVYDDFLDFSKIKKQLINHDVCFYCIGVYQGSVPKEKFIEITYTYFAAFTKTIESKKTTFCLFSAGGANPKSSILFAKWKGMCEESLLQKKFKDIYIFRPQYIHPSDISKLHRSINYYIMDLLYPALNLFAPRLCTTSHQLAHAMVTTAVNGSDKKIFENMDIRNIK